MRISIFGLGYVGVVAAACVAESGHDVIAMDTDPLKIKCLREGRAPVIEPGLADMIARNVAAGRLKATLSCAEAVMGSDISLICVGTPGHADGSLRLDYVVEVCGQIGAVLKDKESFHSVVLRSTVTPGTAVKVAIPALEEASGKTAGVDFGFGSNPEFLREGQAIFDYFNPPKTVIGALDEITAGRLAEIYKDMKAPVCITEVQVAEGVKYADNAWHATKVGFANELGNILKELGVDSHAVMDIFCLDTKLNISKAYLKPGFAFGGSCLPKDLRALRASGKAKGLNTPFFDALLTANEEQVKRAVELVLKSGRKKVGLMGLAFKAGTDDLRESPLVTLADLLIKNGIELTIYDPAVYEAAHMEGANRAYIREGIPHIYKCLVGTPERMLGHAELFIIGNHGEDFGRIIAETNDNAPIIDLVRLKCGAGKERGGYEGICW